MMLRRWAPLVSFVASLLVCLAPAFAAPAAAPSKHWMSVQTCNNFQVTIFVAFAYPEGSEWTSRGWLRVPSGSCKSAKLPTVKVSYRAESDWYADGDVNRRDGWGDKHRYCVAEGRFMFHPADRGCSGGELRPFSTLLQTGQGIRLTFNSKFTNVRFQ
jgi:uncharacterized membrane protein